MAMRGQSRTQWLSAGVVLYSWLVFSWKTRGEEDETRARA
jgi:hypothetical protein